MQAEWQRLQAELAQTKAALQRLQGCQTPDAYMSDKSVLQPASHASVVCDSAFEAFAMPASINHLPWQVCTLATL